MNPDDWEKTPTNWCEAELVRSRFRPSSVPWFASGWQAAKLSPETGRHAEEGSHSPPCGGTRIHAYTSICMYLLTTVVYSYVYI